MSGFVQDTQSASCDTSDGEATRYEISSSEQNKAESVQETFSDGQRMWTEIQQFQSHKTDETESVEAIDESALAGSPTGKDSPRSNDIKVDSQVNVDVSPCDPATPGESSL